MNRYLFIRLLYRTTINIVGDNALSYRGDFVLGVWSGGILSGRILSVPRAYAPYAPCMSTPLLYCDKQCLDSGDAAASA